MGTMGRDHIEAMAMEAKPSKREHLAKEIEKCKKRQEEAIRQVKAESNRLADLFFQIAMLEAASDDADRQMPVTAY